MHKLQIIYSQAKQKIIHNCIKCGNCINQCKSVKITNQHFNVADVQSNIIAFLDGTETLSDESLKKVNSCMGCFGCLDIKCKINVPSMIINELVKWDLSDKNSYIPSEEIYPTQIDQAKRLTTREEFFRITSPAYHDSDYLFFPGCNVYNQPDKLLNALTILDEIGKPYSFAPGLEYCCGFARGCMGDAEWLGKNAEKLVALAESLKIKTLILWCPTCLCVFEDRIKKFCTPSFNIISFGQYVFENINKLSFPNTKTQTVTYHEPCKTAYMGIDLFVRQILNAIPGTQLVEMAHHGHDTICCGCDAVNNAPDIGNSITQKRLEEAVATNSDILIDTCHYCHWVFSYAIKNSVRDKAIQELSIENYSTYITKAMGKEKPDPLSGHPV